MKITKKEKQLACHRGGAAQQRAAAPALKSLEIVV
jgi:hypothetical protein